MQSVINLLTTHGYALLFVMALAERLGLPLLLTPVLLACGVLAGMGHMSVTISILVGTIACVLGDAIWFEIARARGPVVMRWVCKLSLEPDNCVRKSHAKFERGAKWFLLTSKFVPGVSHIAPAAAGATNYSRGDFLLLNSAGSALWVVVTVFSAYVSTRRLDVGGALAAFLPVIVVMVLALMLANVLLKAYRRKRFIEQVAASRIEPQEVMTRIEGGEALYIVDLRHPLDFLVDPRTLPGAVRITPDELDLRSDVIPRDREIILYCT